MSNSINFKASLAGFVLLSAVFDPAAAQNALPAPRQEKPIALVGGTVVTVSGQIVAGGTVVFERGTITAVGSSVTIPENAERIDVSGRFVYPGLIDAYSSVGLQEIPLGSPGTVDVAEAGSVNPNARAEVAVHPESELIPVARSGGITVSVVAPQGGLVSGMAAALMHEGWTWEDMTLRGGVGLIVNWPTMLFTPSPFSQQTKEDWVKQRDRQLKQIRDLFDNARAYRALKKSAGSAMETDPKLEAMLPVLERRTPVIVNASELSEIQAAVAFGEEQNVRIIIAGGYDSWLTADLLKAKNIPVIVSDIQSAGRRWEGYDVVFQLPNRLQKLGITYCIAGDRNPANVRNLPFHAAHASAYGLSRDEALKSITIYPAQILGIADRVGSIEPGKDANLVVADGDVLEISTKILQVYIQGRKSDMRDKHTRLYEKYEGKYRQMKGH